MLEYIVTGQVRTDSCDIVTKMEKVVSETKRRAEVTERYMQKWDEIEHIKRDGREEVNRLNSILIDAGRIDIRPRKSCYTKTSVTAL